MGVGVEVRGKLYLTQYIPFNAGHTFPFWPTLFRDMSHILIRNFGKVL